jgi:hypothetical protein
VVGIGTAVNYYNDSSDSTYAGYPYGDDNQWDGTGTTIYCETETNSKDIFEAFKRSIELYEKSLARQAYIRRLAKIARKPINPHTYYLVSINPFLVRRLCRCNRHGIGLRMRRDK